MPDANSLTQSRSAVTAARATRNALLAQVASVCREIQQLARVLPPNDQQLAELRRRQQSLGGQLSESNAAVREAQSGLNSLIAGFLGQLQGAADFASLTAELPIAFFPVRIETRFFAVAGRGGTLRIRIYPDEILANSHETGLTLAEKAAGSAYWTACAAGENLAAWRDLITGRSSQRAAYIAAALDPSNAGPPPPDRPDTWSQPIEAPLLPDRWIAIAYRNGQEIHRALSSPVVEPLVLTLNPNQDPADRTVLSDQLTIGNDLLWTLDYERATQAGMAFDMPVTAQDLMDGFDRLLVFGVKSSITPDVASQALGDLFQSHHYTRGLAFVPQGTPTNNTSDSPAGYPPPDPNGTRSFAVERGVPLATPASDGTAFFHAFGLDPRLADHVDGARLTEQASAQAMNAAMWPVTLGYFLEHLMQPAFDDATIDEVKAYYSRYVRGRGPLPAFRVGSIPYGVLPATSLSLWHADPNSPGTATQLPPLLRSLLPYWKNAVAAAPHVGRTGDPDEDLTTVLAMEASMRELGVRLTVNALIYANLFKLIPLDGSAFLQWIVSAGTTLMTSIGHPELAPRLLQLVFQEGANLFKYAFVTEKPLSETATLDPNYILTVTKTTALTPLREALQGSGSTTLLYRLLNHGTMLAGARDSFDLLLAHGLATTDDRRVKDLNAIAVSAAATTTIFDKISQPVPAVTGKVAAIDYVLGSARNLFNTRVQDYRDALQVLATLPTAELERLLTETLDTASHRIDAWVTSLATSRLSAMRKRQPSGVHFGAYAWVESLTAKFLTRRHPVTLPDGTVISAQNDSGGFVHAPTLTHASAAAVLRNAYIGGVGGQQPYEMQLSSANVRNARWLLDSIRGGQPAGAVFGYLFERGLHDAQLDQYIDKFRGFFPLVFNPAQDAGLATETVSARNVVDGLQLRTAWLARSGVFAPGGAATMFPDFAALQLQIQAMVDAMDPVADLLVAESVYQLARTNTFAASSALDSAAGTVPPDPEVAEQPRGGTGLTHRVVLVLGGSPPASPWPGPETARSAGNPYVNSWAGRLLGDPKQIVCTVNLSRQVTLADLQIQPLDFLALARTVATTGQSAELDMRVIEAAGVTVGNISYAGPFQQSLELAQTLNTILAKSRSLTPQDFLLPQELGKANIVPSPNPDAANRAAAAVFALTTLQTDLNNSLAANDTGKIRTALRQASLFGIGESYPVSDGASLAAQGAIVQAEVNRRVIAATTAAEPLAVVQAVFGREFVLLEPCEPPFPSELALALGRGLEPSFGATPGAVGKWFQQAARSRPALNTWRKLSLYATATERPLASLEFAQIPYDAATAWVALPFAAEADRPAAGHISLALCREAKPAVNESWFGLFIDDWTDVIPNLRETSGVAFHFDNPGAEAPEAILLAVPPAPAQSWDIETVAAILNETLDLAQVRAVDLELLGTLGQLIPAIYLPTDEANNTMSVNLRDSVVKYGADIVKKASLKG
jgi:hypothetical protein